MESQIADKLGLNRDQVSAAISLLDDDNTVPFIARYRKDRTGNLDEVQIREIRREADRLRELESRRETILETIREQGSLTDELREAIGEADTRAELEDLYAPHKPKRKTRGRRAVDAGLSPVAEAIREGDRVVAVASDYTCEDYPDADSVLQGAKDILAEDVADDPDVRKFVRERMWKKGSLDAKKRRGADENPKYENYYEFSVSVRSAKPHQVLALRRGDDEKELSVGIELEPQPVVRWIADQLDLPDNRMARRYFEEAIAEGLDRLLHPRTERHIRRELESEADEHAIGVFAVNLENLLLQPPLPDRVVLGVDPGYRSGCKLALVDERGGLRATDKIYVHDDRAEKAKETISSYLDRGVDVVAIGNGTASRETEEVVADVVSSHSSEVAFAIVDEAGASVYSASESARREFPDLDASERGAISIARRLQDPLAELVKIDPKSIGVGMYQHDVDQNRLAEKLDAVVEDVVNSVGVDLNAASRELLSHISGVGPALAERIVEHRDQQGPFRRRRELKDVRGIGAKTYEQAAGFLRIREGAEPLDETAIHPENYRLARRLLDACDGEPTRDRLETAIERVETDVGNHTLGDIVESLLRPGRDPRDELDPPELRRDVLSIDDLQEGMQLSGTVRNVVDFGAFVDVGVKEDGLVHISEMADGYVENPHDVVSVGDQIDVVVQSVEVDRGRIGLSIREA